MTRLRTRMRVYFLYTKIMNTDLLIRLQMCGYSRLEAIILLDELVEDGIAEEIVTAIEQEQNSVHILQSESSRQTCW